MPSRLHRARITRIELVAIVWVLGLAGWLILPALSRSRIESRRAACLANLEAIGHALTSYTQANNNCWPFVSKLRSVKVGTESDRWPTLPPVLASYLPPTSPAYRCPGDSRRIAADDPAAAQVHGNTYYESEGLSYEWWWGDARGGRPIGKESISKAKGFGFARADQRLLSDFEPFHEGNDRGAVNVLYADFHARTPRGEGKSPR